MYCKAASASSVFLLDFVPKGAYENLFLVLLANFYITNMPDKLAILQEAIGTGEVVKIKYNGGVEFFYIIPNSGRLAQLVRALP